MSSFSGGKQVQKHKQWENIHHITKSELPKLLHYLSGPVKNVLVNMWGSPLRPSLEDISDISRKLKTE